MSTDAGPGLRPPPLAGVRVIDLTQIYNGPYATFLMARAGAEVIKIEPPDGEHLRRRGSGSGLPFAMLNANKRSVMLDLKAPGATEVLLALADTADVLVENFTPDVMPRLGLGWDVLHARNKRLIYASSSGFGRDGPYRDYPAMDVTVQAISGILGVTGFPEHPPVKAGVTLCDFGAGTHLYAAIVTALLERERSGVGQMVEVSMMEANYFVLTSNIGALFRDDGTSRDIGRTGNRHGGLSLCPYNVYPTRDGFIAIICINDRQFLALTKALDLPELGENPAYATNSQRVPDMDAIDARIAACTAAYDKADLFALLMRHHVPAAPVRTLPEVIRDPHLHQRGALRWIEHPEFGHVVVADSALRLHGCRPVPYAPSQALGADNEALLPSAS